MKRIFWYRLGSMSMPRSGQKLRPILIAGFLLFIGLWAHPAAAQYVCSGNQPGQRVVGMSQGGNGVGAQPLLGCKKMAHRRTDDEDRIWYACSLKIPMPALHMENSW